MKNKIIVFGLVVILLAVGVFVYFSRPVAAPSVDINSKVEPIVDASTTPANKTLKLTIDQAKSTAEFSLNEVLRGTPTLVVGTTNQIAGEIIIDTTNPANSQLGTITVNARTLKTDNTQRNGAIARMILKSEDPANEFIVFKPTSLTGTPTAITPNQEFSFQINGNITLKGVTKPVVFNAKAKLATDNTLTASAETTLTYADFGISVPNFDFLANVEKTTKLKISIVAK